MDSSGDVASSNLLVGAARGYTYLERYSLCLYDVDRGGHEAQRSLRVYEWFARSKDKIDCEVSYRLFTEIS